MLRDSFIYLLSRIFPAILSFVALFIFIKYMSPNDYGLYSLAIVSIGLINVISSQWIRSGMIRFYNHQIPNFLGKTFTFQLLVLVIIITILTIVGLNLNLGIARVVLLLFMLSNLIINEILNNYYRTILKPKLVLFGNIIKNIFFIIMLILFIFIYSKLSFEESLLSYSIGLLISNLYYCFNFREKLKLERDSKLVKNFLVYGFPLTISFALGMLLQNIDKYLITFFLDVKRTGYYSLVYDLFHNSLYMVMGAMAMASLPRVLKQKGDYTKTFNKYIEVVYVISIPLVAALLVLTPEFVTVLNSFNYKTTELILVFVVLATFIHGVNSYIYGQAVQLLQKTNIILIPSIVAVLVNIIINSLLLNLIGVLAAAISSLIAFSISNIMILKKLNKEKHLNFYPQRLSYFLLITIIFVLIVWNINLTNIYITTSIKIFILIIYIGISYFKFKETVLMKEKV